MSNLNAFPPSSPDPPGGEFDIELHMRRLRVPAGFNGLFEGGNRLRVAKGPELADFEYSARGADNEVSVHSPAAVKGLPIIQGLRIVFVGSGNRITIKSGACLAGVPIVVSGDHNAIAVEAGVHLENCTIRICADTSYGRFQAHHNHVVIGEQSHWSNAEVEIRGSENRLEVGKKVYVMGRAQFSLPGYRSVIRIGEETSIQEAFLSAAEIGTRIDIGEDCMLGHGVGISTGDHHPLYDPETMERLNAAANISVGRHVWLCDGVRLAKRSAIGDGCVVGAGTFVNGPVVNLQEQNGKPAPPAHGKSEPLAKNAVIVGAPAHVVSWGVAWSRGMFFDQDHPDIHPDARAQSSFIRGCLRLQRGIELSKECRRAHDPKLASREAGQRLEQAVELLQNAVKAHADYLYALSALGTAFKHLALHAEATASGKRLLLEAKAAYLRALRIDPSHGDSLRGLAEVEALLATGLPPPGGEGNKRPTPDQGLPGG